MNKLAIKAVSNSNQPSNIGRIEESRLRELVSRLGDAPWSNCWGTTAYLSGALPELKFIPVEDAKAFLKDSCERVHGGKSGRARFGDILAIYANKKGAMKFWTHQGELLHTVVCVGRGLYFHQQGCGGQFKIGKLKEILEVYPGRVVRYVRKAGVSKENTPEIA